MNLLAWMSELCCAAIKHLPSDRFLSLPDTVGGVTSIYISGERMLSSELDTFIAYKPFYTITIRTPDLIGFCPIYR
jgi:hypothetical protein